MREPLFFFFLVFTFLFEASPAFSQVRVHYPDTLKLQLGALEYSYLAKQEENEYGLRETNPEILEDGTIRFWLAVMEQDSEIVLDEIYLQWYGWHMEEDFYRRVASADTIVNVYTAFPVDLVLVDSLRKARKTKTLVFEQSYFQSIYATRENNGDLNTGLLFYSCFTNALTFDKVELQRPVAFHWFYCASAYIDSCTFKATFRFHVVSFGPPESSPSVYIANTSFLDTALIGGSYTASITLNNFQSHTWLGLYEQNGFRDSTNQSLFNIDNGRTWKALKLSGRETAFRFGNGITLRGQLDITDLFPSAYGGGYGLSGLYVLDSSWITVNQYSHPESFRLPVSTLKNASIDFRDGNAAVGDPLHFEHLQNLFQSLRDEVSGREISDVTRKNDVIDWIDYQLDFHRRQYLRHKEDKKLSERFELFWLNFVEATVRSGYKGEARFCAWLFSLVFLFALVYLVFFRRTIYEYVTHEAIIEERQLQIQFPHRKKWGEVMIDLFRCLWFSFVLFITPRFHSKYFRFHRKLLAVMIVEWTIGLLLMIIFVVYIASKYPFVKTLFGI
jgi:hypothetical protein